MMPPLAAESVDLAYGSTAVLTGLTLRFAPGTFTALIGPNGCGKSTLLRALARVLAPQAGSVLLGGELVSALPTRAVARALSYLPQTPLAPPGLSVRELIALGRYPHRQRLGLESPTDRQAIAAALDEVGLTSLGMTDLDQLSGGQKQRAWIGMALAQGAALLLLDEPTNHLDLAHQIDVLSLLRRLADGGRTVIVVLHDLQLAARYADRLVALHRGAIAADGPPTQVITPELLRQVFAIEAAVISDPLTGTPLCLPRRACLPEHPA
jgi:iron complex transport system ATP-binding protein